MRITVRHVVELLAELLRKRGWDAMHVREIAMSDATIWKFRQERQ
jgi:hypothetical protein